MLLCDIDVEGCECEDAKTPQTHNRGLQVTPEIERV